jgi:hypothetical protein
MAAEEAQSSNWSPDVYVHYNEGTVNDSLFYSVLLELRREVVTDSRNSLSVTRFVVSRESKICP